MPNCQPELLPEDPVPCFATDCHECGLYEHGSRMVWGEGNRNGRILVILDNPGSREDREGKPYVCGTRHTLLNAAAECGFKSDELYVTYILKRRPARAYNKEETRRICMVHLEQQLQFIHPEAAICLGNVAVQSFFGDPQAEVKKLRGSTRQVKGIPAFVSYHPLAVRRRPNLYRFFLDDWTQLKSYIDGRMES